MTTRRLRAALLAFALLLVPAAGPARAEDPTVLVAARDDGALVRLTLVGRLALTQVLVGPEEDTRLVPTQANGASVAYVTEGERGCDVGLLDATTGTARPVSRDGRSGHLVVSRDGRFRYILKTNEGCSLVSLVRTDAKGRNARTLVAGPTGRAAKRNDVQLSGMGITGDGRTIYVARTTRDQASALLAVDTATGRTRVVKHSGPYKYIYNVVVSPDGKTLAVSFSADDNLSSVRVGLVPAGGGAVRLFERPGDLHASAFTADGSGVVLTSQGYPLDVSLSDRIHLADVTTLAVQPIAGTSGLFQAVPAG